MSKPDYAKLLADSILPQKDLIRGALRIGLALRTCPFSESNPKAGDSWLGGRPLLPAEFRWPTWKGRPLSFIAQIDVAGLPHFPERGVLPEKGRLSFFYDGDQDAWGFDPADQGSAAVFFDNSAPPELMSVTTPAGREDARTGPQRVTSFEPVLTAPSEDSPWIESLGLSGEQRGLYYDILSAAGAGDGAIVQAPFHQMFGHPEIVQGSMELECELVSSGLYCGDARGYEDPRAEALKDNAKDWVLLLQVDSDEAGGWMWGDSGMIYYWIRRDDLCARRFDRTWLILQCF